MVKIFLRKKITNRIAEGHDWIYENEIGDISGMVADGDEVSVYAYSGSFLGKGWYHSQAAIRIRLYSRQPNENLDLDFFEKKIHQAFAHRAHIDSDVKRLFHAESDGISGLYIDQWKQTILVKTTVKALDSRFEIIAKAIQRNLTTPYHIIKDDTHPLRKFEQLQVTQLPSIEPFEIVENGTAFTIGSTKDYGRDRALIRQFLAGQVGKKIVWDLFCGHANFAQVALQRGASRVVAVDNEDCISPKTKDSGIVFLKENVFDFLKKDNENAKPQILILDMPAFPFDESLQPYKELGLQALRQLNIGGLLVLGFNSSKISKKIIEQLLKYWMHHLALDLPIVYECHAAEDFPRHILYPHTAQPHFIVLRKNLID